MQHVTFMTTEVKISPSWWRVLSPASWIERGELSVSIQRSMSYTTDDVPPNSIVVLLRGSGTNRQVIDTFVDTLHDRGCTIIYDMDDNIVEPCYAIHLDHMTPGGLSVETVQIELDEQDIRRYFISRCDGVTVSTSALKLVLSKYVSVPIIVVPNAIDHEWFTARLGRPPVRFSDDEVYIGWAGSGRPLIEFENMAKAWEIIAQKYSNVYFMLGGWRPNNILARIPADRLIFHSWKDMGLYPESYQVDIACLPLYPTEFNRCKSAIKAMEYTLANAAIVAEPTVYGDFVPHEEGGFIVWSVDEWVYYLSRLIESPHLRQYFNRFMKEKLKDHTMETQWYRWPKAFEDIKELANA